MCSPSMREMRTELEVALFTPALSEEQGEEVDAPHEEEEEPDVGDTYTTLL